MKNLSLFYSVNLEVLLSFYISIQKLHIIYSIKIFPYSIKYFDHNKVRYKHIGHV